MWALSRITSCARVRIAAGEPPDGIPGIGLRTTFLTSPSSETVVPAGSVLAWRRNVAASSVDAGRARSAGRLHADGARSDARQRARLRREPDRSRLSGSSNSAADSPPSAMSLVNSGSKKRRAGRSGRALLVARRRTGDARSASCSRR